MGSKSKSKQSSSSQNVSQNQGVNSSVGMNYGMNQSGNLGSNNSTSQNGSQSTQDVWGAQSPFLQDVYGQGQNAFNQTMEQYQNMSPEVQQQMQDSYAQASGGFGNQMGGGFSAGLQGQIGPNSYVDAMKGQVADDANRLKQQNLGGLDARAAAAGMSGSSGYRNQVSDMARNVDESAMDQMSQIGYNAHNQGIQNQMALAGQMDQNQANAMGNLGNMQQGAMAQFNPAMMGQQIAQNYAGTVGGPTTLGNSSSFGSSNSSGTNMGFSNGMNMGMNMSGGTNIGNSFGSSTGQGSSSSMSVDGAAVAAGLGAMSDARLKENIKHVEQIDGINMYTWDWKDPAMSSPMSYGVIAQEVAETHPEAVVTGDHGYMMVDYSKLGRAGEAALSRMEG